MLEVSQGCSAESVFLTFHKVATATTVTVRFDATRGDISTVGVDVFSTIDKQTIVFYF